MTYDLSLFPLATFPLQLCTYGNSFAGVSGTVCRSRWSRGLRWGSAVAHLLGLRVRILRVHGCVSLESAVSCQVQISASDWALVQRGPTESGVLEVWPWSLDNEEALAPWGMLGLGKKISDTELPNDWAWFYLPCKLYVASGSFALKNWTKRIGFVILYDCSDPNANRYQFPLNSALIWSSLHGQIPSGSLWNTHRVSRLCPKLVRISFSASQLHTLLAFPLINPDWSSPSISSVFLPVLLLRVLATAVTVCAMKLTLR